MPGHSGARIGRALAVQVAVASLPATVTVQATCSNERSAVAFAWATSWRMMAAAGL
jgi:hypothetical protein